jgi:hypothetical protein
MARCFWYFAPECRPDGRIVCLRRRDDGARRGPAMPLLSDADALPGNRASSVRVDRVAMPSVQDDDRSGHFTDKKVQRETPLRPWPTIAWRENVK